MQPSKLIFIVFIYSCISLFRHPCGVLKGQFSTADLLLTQVNVLPELSYSIQRSVMLEAQPTDLKTKKRRDTSRDKGRQSRGT